MVLPRNSLHPFRREQRLSRRIGREQMHSRAAGMRKWIFKNPRVEMGRYVWRLVSQFVVCEYPSYLLISLPLILTKISLSLFFFSLYLFIYHSWPRKPGPKNCPWRTAPYINTKRISTWAIKQKFGGVGKIFGCATRWIVSRNAVKLFP